MNNEEEVRNDILKDKNLTRRLFGYAKPYIKTFLIVMIFIAYSAFAVNYIMILFGECLDVLNVEGATYSLIKNKVILIFVLIVTGMGVQYIKGVLLNKVGQKMLYDIRMNTFSHIEKLSLKEIDSIPVGKFVTRVTNDANNLSNLFSTVVVTLISETSYLIGAIISMIILSPKLTLTISIIFPITFIGALIFRKYSRIRHKNVSDDHSALNSFISENLSGMKITQIFNKEESKLKEFDKFNEKLKKDQDKVMIVFAIFRPFIYVMMFLTTILIFYYGSLMVFDGLITAGVLYSFYQLLYNLFTPIQNIAQQYNVLQSAYASAEKIFSVLDMDSSIIIKDNPIKVTDFKGEIEFRNVWFRYKEEKWIIKDMSFHIKPNEVVSFVGPTGAGKTTILSLIGRYYDIEKGEILIDGINVKDYDIYSLREAIGEMLQDVFLFSGTIRDNLTLRDHDISDDEIIEACKYVNAHNFICNLENGYDEVVKERGNNYSQGERQLLSFARTILSKPKMIILDEATSNIDTETEVLIQDSLKKIQSVGTTLMVAHRLSTIQHSDRIYFVDDGRIVESGNHQELLKLKGRYYSLYELQYK